MRIIQTGQAAVASLHPHPANARIHPKKQVAQLARSINQFGFTSSIVVDENGVILAGHGRWLAAKQLGLKVVPIITISGLTEAEKRAYLLADNKLVENAGWDPDVLSFEIKALIPELTKEGLDIELTGFKPAEIRSLTKVVSDSEPDPEDEPPLFQGEQVTRPGDLWCLGRHRLLCGNAADAADMALLMGEESAAMVILDPGNQCTSILSEI
jgi:ParB-like chromosome segregation protein Spo0J